MSDVSDARHQDIDSPQARGTGGTPPGADFSDHLMRLRFEGIEHVGRKAYLLALAAWQRGLRVTFHYEMASHCPRFAHLPFSGFRGEFLTICDGRSPHTFFRVLGDRVSQEVSAVCESKPHTKAVLKKAGVDVPAGVVVESAQHAVVDRFLASCVASRFLLKPLAGTLGQGVVRNLTKDEVRKRVSALDEPMLLEEFLIGKEFRVYVAGTRLVSAGLRRPASVEGDGRHTIRELVDKKAAMRRTHPDYRKDPLVLDKAAEAFLAARGYTTEQIPTAGERVYLNDTPGTQFGGDFVDGMPELSEAAAEAAKRTVAALSLPVAGVDLLVLGGKDNVSRVVVLEANQNPYIDYDVLPFPGVYRGGGNRIAESIIDEYFPHTVDNPRHPRASFDFNAICRMLQTGSVREVTLPVLDEGWTHERLSVPATRLDPTLIDRMHQARLRLGIHVELMRTQTGDLIMDGLAPKALWKRFFAEVQ